MSIAMPVCEADCFGVLTVAQVANVDGRSDTREDTARKLPEDEFIFGTGQADDPELPRYLCIGDSISSNYSKAIIDLHAGKLNSHHPPENCRSSAEGRQRIDAWLGDYKSPGNQWDIISFNFGHWDANENKTTYQDNLRAIIAKLKLTKAKLVWVTTCPIPDGLDESPLGIWQRENLKRAPGRLSGVARDLLNPWAQEVVSESPEITVCDQWQFVYENRNGIYKTWWRSEDVHFSQGPAYSIGRLLAQHVLERMGLYRPAGFLQPSSSKLVSSALAGKPWTPPNVTEIKTGEFYSNNVTLAGLSERWKSAKRFQAGFPMDFPITLASEVPDEHGWNYQLDELPNHLRLNAIKDKTRLGFGLAYFDFQALAPNEEDQSNIIRSRFGPGVPGDEFFVRIARGSMKELKDDDVPQQFDFAFRNVSTYYDLYRITRDRYYSDQLATYAKGMMMIRRHCKQAGFTSTSDPGFVWAQVNGARLILEQVRIDQIGIVDWRLKLAKQLITDSLEHLSETVNDKFISPFRVDDGKETAEFQPGRNTLWLVEQRFLPRRAAQELEYSSWRKTMRTLTTLTAAVRAMEEYQGIAKSKEYAETIKTYRQIIAAGLELFQRENDSVIGEGRRPYFFHSHFPMQDKPREARLSHPVFKGESIQNAIEIANDLTYIWEANESFGCSTALVVGYANGLVDQLEYPTSGKGGELFPRNRIDSPWYIASSSERGVPADVLLGDALFLSVFSNRLLQNHRRWTLQRAPHEELQLLKAVALFREWKRRQSRVEK